MKRKNILIIVFFVVLAICILITCYISKNKESNKDNTNLSFIDLQEFNLKEREKLFVNDELLIGENIKQLENGYYDFKIATDNNQVIITLNKLWYEEYGTDYIQDEYLAKICREIIRVLNYTSDDAELEYQLYKYIKDNYLSVRQGKEASKLEIERVSIYAKEISSECIVYIKVE